MLSMHSSISAVKMVLEIRFAAWDSMWLPIHYCLNIRNQDMKEAYAEEVNQPKGGAHAEHVKEDLSYKNCVQTAVCEELTGPDGLDYVIYHITHRPLTHEKREKLLCSGSTSREHKGPSILGIPQASLLLWMTNYNKVCKTCKLTITWAAS